MVGINLWASSELRQTTVAVGVVAADRPKVKQEHIQMRKSKAMLCA